MPINIKTLFSTYYSWLLHRVGNILLIRGTTSLDRLGKNVRTADIMLNEDDMRELNTLSA